MAKYRASLPQLDGNLFLADGGIETTLIFHEGQDLPDFAAFHLFRDPSGKSALQRYFQSYAALARRYQCGLVLETATWRSSRDWGAKLGYSPEALASINEAAVHMLENIRQEYECEHTPIVISGCIGPRGDGYVPDLRMPEKQAERYHREQIATFSETGADLVTAMTMNYVEEAIGIVRAAQSVSLPVVIAFTVETDGRLPTGQSLQEAIHQVDDTTASYPAYYMINCAHPSHFEHILPDEDSWSARVRGLRANASRMSHAELNNAEDLDAGNPVELGMQYAALRQGKLKHLNVMGGCCGTDHRHIEQIAMACQHQRRC